MVPTPTMTVATESEFEIVSSVAWASEGRLFHHYGWPLPKITKCVVGVGSIPYPKASKRPSFFMSW